MKKEVSKAFVFVYESMWSLWSSMNFSNVPCWPVNFLTSSLKGAAFFPASTMYSNAWATPLYKPQFRIFFKNRLRISFRMTRKLISLNLNEDFLSVNFCEDPEKISSLVKHLMRSWSRLSLKNSHQFTAVVFVVYFQKKFFYDPKINKELFISRDWSFGKRRNLISFSI